jgi:peptidoglycan/LPS O-acetylase OafA/YrhL
VSTVDEPTLVGTVGRHPIAESELPERSGGVHFGTLDGYRALAALMVLVTHVAFMTGAVATWRWGYVLQRFDFGVTLFFLLSGFLLYRPWVKTALLDAPRPSLRRYSLRRAARVLPAYWVVVIATLLLVPQTFVVDGWTWVSHLLTGQIYTGGRIADGLFHTWSLCTEIAFYVLLPVVGHLGLGRGARAPARALRRQIVVLGGMVVVAATFTLLRLTTELLPENAGLWLPAYLDWFAAGMLLALVEVRVTRADPPRWVRTLGELAQDPAVCLVLALSFFFVACTPLGGPYDLSAAQPWETFSKHWLYLLTAFCLLLPATVGHGAGWSAALGRPLIQRVGLISYGIFLWHMMLIFLLMPALGIPWFTGQSVLVLTVVLAATLATATVSYVVLERPIQRWAHTR